MKKAKMCKLVSYKIVRIDDGEPTIVGSYNNYTAAKAQAMALKLDNPSVGYRVISSASKNPFGNYKGI